MNDDIEIPSVDEEGNFDPKSVKELIEECQQRVKKYALPYLSQAQFNERMITGDQFVKLSGTFEINPDDSWPDDVPHNSRNLMRNLSLTWSSRILEDRPNVMCFPAEPGADMKKADVANKVLEYVRQNHDFDDMCFTAAQLVQPHSAVGFKVIWDPLSGPPSPGIPVFDELGFPVLDETGNQKLEGKGEPLGDIRWDVVSIFDYATDGAENIEDSKWVYFTTHIDYWDAVHLVKSANLDPKDVSPTKYTDVWGSENEGVLVTELWWKPDFRFPQGLFAVMVGDLVVQAGPFPYAHRELPLAVWKCGPRRRSPYGATHVDDAVYIQKTINEIVAAMSRQARQIRDVMLLAHSAILKGMEAGNRVIPVDAPEIISAARYLEPPDRAKVLVSSLEDNVQALYSVYGLNEMLTGAESMKSGTAAKSIAYLNKLDSMKMAGAARSLGKAILRVMRQTLKLYQQWCEAPRLAQIAGANNLFDGVIFSGADIAGVDVRIEAATGFENYRATVVQEANDNMQQQGPTPELLSQAKTGLRQSAYDKSQREVVQSQIQAILRGQPTEADPQIDSGVAVDEIMSVLSQYDNSNKGPILRQLLAQYQQFASQQAAPQNGNPQ